MCQQTRDGDDQRDDGDDQRDDGDAYGNDDRELFCDARHAWAMDSASPPPSVMSFSHSSKISFDA